MTVINKNSAEKILKEIIKLNAIEVLGICKILNIQIYEEENVEGAQALENGTPRKFEDIWGELCEKVWNLNRVQRRTLGKLVRAATKGGK